MMLLVFIFIASLLASLVIIMKVFEKNEESVANSNRFQEITIGVMSGPEAEAHKRLAPLFEKERGIKVNIEEMDGESFYTKMLPVLTSRSGDYDVLLLHSESIKQWVKAGFLEPLDPYMKDPNLFDAEKYNLDDIHPAILDELKADGKLYGLPQEVSSLLLFYRKDLFEKYGIKPPSKDSYTWNEYLEAAQRMTMDTNADGKIDLYGTVHAGKNSSNLAVEAMVAIWSYGGTVVSDDYGVGITKPEAIKAIQMYLSQDKKGLTPPGSANWDYPDVLAALQQGKAAMAIGWNSMANILNDPQQSPKTAGQWDWRPVPYDDQLGAKTKRAYPALWAWGISSDSKHKEAAFNYIAWFTSKEIARDYVMNGGGSSGRKSLLSNPEILHKNPQYEALSESISLFHKLPPIQEKSYLIFDLLPKYIHAALISDKPVEEYLKQAALAIQQFLQKKGYISTPKTSFDSQLDLRGNYAMVG